MDAATIQAWASLFNGMAFLLTAALSAYGVIVSRRNGVAVKAVAVQQEESASKALVAVKVAKDVATVAHEVATAAQNQIQDLHEIVKRSNGPTS